MSPTRLALLALPLAALAFASTADAAQKRSRQQAYTGDAATAKLNEESLARAKAGQNVLTGGPDTTSNLNAISERAASQGRNMNQAPMPFR